MSGYPFPRTLFIGYLALASVYIMLMPSLPFQFDWLIKASPVLLLAGVAFRESHLRLLTFALVASAAGDILLAQSFAFSFETGMLAFGLAHLAYGATFWPWRAPSKGKGICIAVLAFAMLGIMTVLLPQAGALAIPILIYALVILLMSTTAILAASRQVWMLPAGAGIFVLSDTLIGINVFLEASNDSKTSVMLTYYTAQWLLFWGARRRALAA